MNLKLKFLIVFILLFVGNVGFCSISFPPLKPVSNTVAIKDSKDTAENINLLNIASIEKELFGKSYGSQNIIKRISRIEKRLFYTTFPNSPASQRVDNIVSNFNKLKTFPCISQKSLNSLEEKVLGQKNLALSPDKRLELLEEKLFGAVQSGDVESRLKSVQLASGNVNQNVNTNVEYADTNSLWSLEERNTNMMPVGGMTVNSTYPDYYSRRYSNYDLVPKYDKYLKIRPYVPNYTRPPMHKHINPQKFYPHSSNLNRPTRCVNSNGWRGVNTGIGATILN